MINGVVRNPSNFGYLQFDGTNDYTEFGVLQVTSYTLSIWFNATGVPSHNDIYGGVLYSNNPQYFGAVSLALGYRWDNNTFLVFQNSVGNITSNYVPANKITNAVVTYDGSYVKVYIDGKISYTLPYTTDPTYPGSGNLNMKLGAWGYSGYERYFNGHIYQFSIHNRALSAEEVLSLYEQPYQFIDPPAALKYYSYSQHRSLTAPSITSNEIIKLSHTLYNPRYETKNIIGQTRRSKDYTISTSSITTNYIKLTKPINLTVNNIGTSGSTSYSYRVSAYDKDGNETDTSIISTNNGNSSLSSNNFNRISWDLVEESYGYKIYGRTQNNEQLIANVKNTYYDDTGSVTPNGTYKTINQTGYNPNKINLGKYFYLGSDNNLSYIKAHDLESIKPLQDISGTNKYIVMGDIVKWSDDINWFFGIRHDTSPRQIALYSHNKKTNKKTYIGDFSIENPDADVRTFRDINAALYRHNAGYASLSGTSVTGINTNWVQSRLASGARIGFGSKDPQFIKTWFEISTIDSENGITISDNLFNESYNNVPYVIEEIRCIVAFYNNTRGYSEIYLFKGINYFDFTKRRSLVKVLSNDNRKGYYRLAEISNIFSIGGLALEPQISDTEHNLYVLSYLSSPANAINIHKYNIRASLTVSNNISTSAFLFKCGGTFITGSGLTYRAITYAVPNYHPYKNRPVLVLLNGSAFTIIPISNLYADNVDIYESPQESLYSISTDTQSLWAASVYDIAYDSSIDRFIQLFDAHTYGKYPSLGQINQFELEDAKLYINSNYPALPIMPEGMVEHISFAFGNFRCRICDGWYYLMREYGDYYRNTIFITPISGHWLYADQTKNFVILPKIKIDKMNLLKKINIRSINFYGNTRYGIPAEPLRYYIRTSGIDDDSGAWTYVDSHGDISNIINSGEIQIKIETHMFAMCGLTKKIYGYSLEYDEPSLLPFGMAWNYEDTDQTTGAVGFIQNKLINTMPSLKISYYRKSDQKLIFTQNTSNSSNGYFQYYDNNWITGYGPDQIGLRRRFIPADVLQKNIEYIVVIGLM